MQFLCNIRQASKAATKDLILDKVLKDEDDIGVPGGSFPGG
jgi:hypothetical protein